MMLRDVGEKRLIAEYIRPLFNPRGTPEGVGDDCGLIPVDENTCVCVSTDRVPADLIAFKLGLIGFRELGQYLAVLNISDIAAAGGEPKALLLNLAFPADFDITDLQEILRGAKESAEGYATVIIGGDLSDASEMNLVATSIGFVRRHEVLLRNGAQPGDKVFCSDYVGLTASAFLHYLYRGPIERMHLNSTQEAVLTKNFRKPTARVALGRQLAVSGCCTSAMDVTDGVAQSFSEIAGSSGVGIILDVETLPIHPLSKDVASWYGADVFHLVLGAGADFQLVGTINPGHPNCAPMASQVKIVGDVVSGTGTYLRKGGSDITPLVPEGWNYYL
jgi:thiamine-monophosphate kinase